MAGPPVERDGIWRLQPTNPPDTEEKRHGANWFRFVQAAVRNTFPNVNAPVLVPDSVLNQPIPVGCIMAWGGDQAQIPTGWLECDGRAITAQSNPILHFLVGDNLPDLRGEFIRGLDSGRGIDDNRVQGSAQAEMIGPHNHPATTEFQFYSSAAGANHPAGGGGNVRRFGFLVNVENNTGTENRPRNVALIYIIRAEYVVPAG